MIEGFPYTEFPSGWFQVGWSAQIERGQVVPLEYFGRKLICFRGQSGQVAVMDAFCPHMGAHLAYGGIVEEGGIRCGYHGWCWGQDGKLADIPYGARRTLKVAITTYPSVEMDGIILMWFDALNRGPTWEPPRILPTEGSEHFFDLFPHCVGEDRIRMQPQMMVENTVDFPHLVWTHRWTAGEPELLRYESQGHRFVAQMAGYLPTAKGTVRLEVTENMYGLGLIVAPMTGVRNVINVAGTTPINEDYSRVHMSVFVSCPEDADPAIPDSLAQAIVSAQRQEVIGSGDKGDRKIWENQRYVARPPLVAEEADGMRTIRRWCSQFYPNQDAAAGAIVDGREHRDAIGIA